MNELDEIYANFVVELRRGVTNLVVLNQCQQPTYGYQLVKELSESGIPWKRIRFIRSSAA